MRVMVLIKGDQESEAGVLPDLQYVEAMNQFNENLVKAGVLLAAEGLYPSAMGKRVVFSGGKTRVVDGPFTETKELIVGFWLWQVKSMDEAVEWVKRIPAPANATEGVIELRPVFEVPDLTAELKDRQASTGSDQA
jgi:hypothetical protein